ncbi:hypothetical protein V6Z11_A07G037400 [Gossypium hirsutum]
MAHVLEAWEATTDTGGRGVRRLKFGGLGFVC